MMRKGVVLLVDDEEVVLRMQAAAVRQFGFQAIIADSAATGIEAAVEHRPDLIVTDVQMPGEGGFDFVSSLESRGIKDMPVIYLTGYDDAKLVKSGLRAGGDDFVIKGAPIETLRRRIAFWMASGFQGLPVELRRRALKMAEDESVHVFAGVESSLDLKHGLINGVSDQLREEMRLLSEDYGTRLVERVCIVGRASKLLIDAATSAGELIRFPDNLRLVCQRLQRPFLDDLSSIYRDFSSWTQDLRFVRAGPEPLKAFADYDVGVSA